MVTDDFRCLGLCLEVWNQKVDHKCVRADLRSARLAGDPAGKILGAWRTYLVGPVSSRPPGIPAKL